MPPPGQNYEHRYHDSFEEAKRNLGLTGEPFDYFWQNIAQILDDNPFNVYSSEVPETEGFRVYPTLPAHEDFPACVVYFSVEDDSVARRIHYYGIEALPDDWTYLPLNL